MYCIPLLELDELNDIQRNSLDSFFEKFLPNGYVTVSKAAEFTGMQEKIVIDTFSKLYLCGYLDIMYAVKCPECGMLIKKIDNVEYFNYEGLNYCYACEEPIELSNDDIVALFIKKERSPFVKGQHLNNELIIKQNGDVAQNDGVPYLMAISENFADVVSLFTYCFKEKDSENKKTQKIRNSAYKRYKKNKRIFNIASICFRCLSLIILFWIMLLAGFEKDISGILTIVIYAFQNVIDVILRSAIVTDLNEIEREELFLANK